MELAKAAFYLVALPVGVIGLSWLIGDDAWRSAIRAVLFGRR